MVRYTVEKKRKIVRKILLRENTHLLIHIDQTDPNERSNFTPLKMKLLFSNVWILIEDFGYVYKGYLITLPKGYTFDFEKIFSLPFMPFVNEDRYHRSFILFLKVNDYELLDSCLEEEGVSFFRRFLIKLIIKSLMPNVYKEKVCQRCGTKKRMRGKYCSRKCGNVRLFTEEIREKISKSVSEKFLDEEYKEQQVTRIVEWNKLEENREKLSEAKLEWHSIEGNTEKCVEPLLAWVNRDYIIVPKFEERYKVESGDIWTEVDSF